jgi:phage repressor protein C with HTH and peptisase S24 domain
MLSHGDLWRAIDLLAAKYGMSPSGLARRAGLDPTTFNKSKRTARDGKLRWLGSESISKILEATGASLAEFAGLAGDLGDAESGQVIPIIDTDQLGGQGNFDRAGFPSGAKWGRFAFAQISDPRGFALKVLGGDLAPVYGDGDILVVSPAASPRRGGRVLVKSRDGGFFLGLFSHRNAQELAVSALTEAQASCTIANEAVEWIAPIVWTRQ